ncbi:MAG TPA: CAP domain-containing protein [Terracidiphilus sp.]|nr:CAP domain-containing protein [Terracidiphilus sp.]
MNTSGKQIFAVFALLALCVWARSQAGAQSRQAVEPGSVQLMALANEARAAAGAAPLRWDNALAEAARKHCLRMAAEGPIAHRYPGELDLSERAGLAGVHFDLVEENVAIGPTPSVIHEEWMHSTGHRENMLNPDVDRVGIAVIASRGVLYATADYAHGVQVLSQTEIEKHVAELIRPSGVAIGGSTPAARVACTMENGVPRSSGSMQPLFVMRWQDSDLSHLPKELADQLASGRYRGASVGSCEPSGAVGTFTAYRVAVLLY